MILAPAGAHFSKKIVKNPTVSPIYWPTQNVVYPSTILAPVGGHFSKTSGKKTKIPPTVGPLGIFEQIQGRLSFSLFRKRTTSLVVKRFKLFLFFKFSTVTPSLFGNVKCSHALIYAPKKKVEHFWSQASGRTF